MLLLVFAILLLTSETSGLGETTVCKKYIWKGNLEVHYTCTSPADIVLKNHPSNDRNRFPNQEDSKLLYDHPKALLIPGFGVGTFHYERNRQMLADSGFEVYSADLLGQGQSWPLLNSSNDQESLDFRYSLDSWKDQLVYFIETIMCHASQEPVHLVGNSLGGYLSVMIAYFRPDLVKSITLLNATPIWAFNSYDNGHFLWNGVVRDMPNWALNLGRRYFNTLRSPKVIKEMLSLLYQSAGTIDDKLISDIVSSASHPLGPTAFTSIAFSPKSRQSFDEMLSEIDDRKCPICLIYGKEDPWITPLWGQRIKRIKPKTLYFEISPVGHCPHHEASRVVNKLLPLWWNAVDSSRRENKDIHLDLDAFERIRAECITSSRQVTISVEMKDGSPSTFVETVIAYCHSKELRRKNLVK